MITLLFIFLFGIAFGLIGHQHKLPWWLIGLIAVFVGWHIPAMLEVLLN